MNTTDPHYFKWTQWIFLQIYGSWFNPDTNKAEPISTLPYPPELQVKAGTMPDCSLEAKRRIYRDSKRLAYVSEARDTVVAIIAPALKVRTFLRRGRELARALQVHRANRPMQLTTAAKILNS